MLLCIKKKMSGWPYQRNAALPQIIFYLLGLILIIIHFHVYLCNTQEIIIYFKPEPTTILTLYLSIEK
ncbi:MAG TPA: hypothetical protein DDY25_05125, partial [Peptococcaceae bacterium]|nr:hypothetical protein [Peptococcaceae bacterium]